MKSFLSFLLIFTFVSISSLNAEDAVVVVVEFQPFDCPPNPGLARDLRTAWRHNLAMGIANSLAIVFDTFDNNGSGFVQSGTAMLAQANALPNSVLRLLQQ